MVGFVPLTSGTKRCVAERQLLNELPSQHRAQGSRLVLSPTMRGQLLGPCSSYTEVTAPNTVPCVTLSVKHLFPME